MRWKTKKRQGWISNQQDQRKERGEEGSVPDTEVEDLALEDKGVKGVHDLLDGSRVIPPGTGRP
jgi:hypothetical protein